MGLQSWSALSSGRVKLLKDAIMLDESSKLLLRDCENRDYPSQAAKP
jgi:hypothetical protein